MQHGTTRWMGVLAVACTMQFACGRAEDARSGQVETAQPGTFDGAPRQIQVTGCVERGIIPGSFMLTSVRTGEGGAASGESRGTSGTASEGEAGAGTLDGLPDGAVDESYTLRAIDGRHLGEYVGRRVAVQGTVMTNQAYEGETAGTSRMPSHGAEGAVGPDTSEPQPGAPGASMPLQQLAAEQVEVVADTCGASGAAEVGARAPQP